MKLIYCKYLFCVSYTPACDTNLWRSRFKGTDSNSKDVIHLTWEELMRLLEFEIPEKKQYLARVRDVFCFTCFTGLRFSNVAKLRRSDVKPHHIEIVTQKTVDGLKIKLNKYSRALLDKYRDFNFKNDNATPGDHQFTDERLP